MKYILLFLLTVTLAFSSEKKIILGTYANAKYSANTLERVNNLIDKDQSLKIFMNLNHLNVQVDKIGLYNVVSIKPFTDYQQLLYVMSKFEKHYSDLYVLPPYKDNSIHTNVAKPIVVAKPTVVVKTEKKPVVVPKVEKKPIEVVKKIQEAVKPVVAIKTTEPVFQDVAVKQKKLVIKEKVVEEETPENFAEDNLLIEEEIDDTFDKKDFFNYQIAITIVIAIILLLILINTIIKLRHSSKKEKYTPYLKDE